MRDMQAAITVPWTQILSEIHRVLVPGGIAHFGEFIYNHMSDSEVPATRRQFRRSCIKRFESQLQLVYSLFFRD